MLRILAAFLFFTRLPLWRVVTVPPEQFKRMISCWSVTGWLTAGVSAATLLLCTQIMPYSVAILLAVGSRLFLTGALHEDGLADFFDGFGGGSTRERTLEIMKDSHIGSYGVISLIIYFLIYTAVLNTLPLDLTCAAILCGDPFCKSVCSFIVNRLPYARPVEESKSQTINSPMNKTEIFTSLLFGLSPVFLFISKPYWAATLTPILLFLLLTRFLKKRIQGYTGDCCGAIFLLCELSFFLTISIIYTLFPNP